MPDPTELAATELVRLYGEKALSPLDVWEALEPKIAAVEPNIQSLYAYDPATARAAAAASAERWARGRPLGRLDGVPVTIKELIATKGVAVPQGSAATAMVPASDDAPAAARLREDGAVIFAKTTCPDYGMLTSGVSSFHPLTRNPWDLSRNPGGSSSGAAAAGAAGLGPLHVGTDIGGSIRLPAGLTGLVGFKPSNGRIPLDPFYLGRCAGPMTRTVADAALAMTALARPDLRDATSLAFEEIDWLALDGAEVSGLRIGLMLEAGCGLATEPEIATAIVEVARRFEAAGARIVELPGLLTRSMLDGLDDFWRARLWGDLETLPPDRLDRVLPYIRAWAEGGAMISGVRAVAGFNQTYAMRCAAGRLFSEVDFLLTPTNPIVSYPAGWASPTNDPAQPFEHIAFTVPWNMGEQPALSINCGWSSDGMPIGLQLVGPRFADVAVLRLAKLYETWRGPITTWP